MSGWLIENNTVIDAQMGIMVGGGRDTIVRNNNFIRCDSFPCFRCLLACLLALEF